MSSTVDTVKKVGILGGSSLFHSEIFKAFEPTVVETVYGKVQLYTGILHGKSIVFCQRHHAQVTKDSNSTCDYQQPHEINYKAIITALKDIGCQKILGVYSVGSMTLNSQVGTLVLPDDHFNPFNILNFSSSYDAHVVPGMSEPFRADCLRILQENQITVKSGGVYVQATGPRFETKAEIRFFAQCGEYVGMTGGNEAELINELGTIEFCMLAIVDNMAHGIVPSDKLNLEGFKAAQKKNVEIIETAVKCLITNL